ncbi:COA8 family protein CBG23705, mitochondrial-like isoform X2 [Littorina saxatilis]|uniref:COA8 family protein CBG23705, mitochondrial-like isoform X2 n=1 Tax=Littorina saxatilis TaxID=31220 RepID=UPI0038B55443
MFTLQRNLCLSCTRRRLLSSVSSKSKEEKFKIEAEPPPPGTKDWIGPPDPVSNIRPIKFQVHKNESNTERSFRKQQAANIEWNHDFWQKHNNKFFKEKEDFVEKIKEESGEKASSDQLSQFYKKFLDENREWYVKNISLLWPALQVAVIKTIRRLRPIKKS